MQSLLADEGAFAGNVGTPKTRWHEAEMLRVVGNAVQVMIRAREFDEMYREERMFSIVHEDLCRSVLCVCLDGVLITANYSRIGVPRWSSQAMRQGAVRVIRPKC